MKHRDRHRGMTLKGALGLVVRAVLQLSLMLCLLSNYESQMKLHSTLPLEVEPLPNKNV